MIKEVVYLSESQYLELKTNGTITVGEITLVFNEDTLYVTKDNISENLQNLTEDITDLGERVTILETSGDGVSQEDFDKLLNNTTEILSDADMRLKIGGTQTVGEKTVAIGHLGNARGKFSVAVGVYSVADGEKSIGVGCSARTYANQSVAIGYSPMITTPAQNSIVLGTGTCGTPNVLQIFNDRIYNHETHTLTVQNIELNGVDLATELGKLDTALKTILGV